MTQVAGVAGWSWGASLSNQQGIIPPELDEATLSGRFLRYWAAMVTYASICPHYELIQRNMMSFCHEQVNGESQKKAEEITAEVAIALTLSQLHPEAGGPTLKAVLSAMTR